MSRKLWNWKDGDRWEEFRKRGWARYFHDQELKILPFPPWAVNLQILKVKAEILNHLGLAPGKKDITFLVSSMVEGFKRIEFYSLGESGEGLEQYTVKVATTGEATVEHGWCGFDISMFFKGKLKEF